MAKKRTNVTLSLNEKELIGVEGLVHEYRMYIDPYGQVSDVPDSVILKQLLGMLALAVAEDRINMIEFVLGMTNDGK